jgi:hypothetical protein
MSTKASTYTLLSEPSEELIVSEPWSIDNYADGLMDELFADIDHILDGRGGLPIPTIEPEFVRLQSIRMPPTILQTTELKSNSPSAEANNQQLSRVAKPNSAAPKTVKVHKKPKRWLGKLIGWSAATVGLVASVVFVQSSGLLNRLVSNSFQQSLLPSKPQAQPELANQSDVQADLVKYMLGALSIIDRESVKSNYQSTRTAYTAALTPNQSANQASLLMASNQGSSKLPPPMAANNIQPTASRAATVVERIYIPVYQAPLPMRYAPPAVPGFRGLPQVPSQPLSAARLPKPYSVKTALNNVSKNVDKVTKPLNVFAAVRPALKPLTIQSQPITLSQPKPPTIKMATFRATPPKLPTATAPEPKPATPAPASNVQVAVAPTNPISHTLEGLLELGDKSAALFKINGLTRRIEIGEGIGTSGWTLVEVANGEAVIRRNGEVRSIYAGQDF